MITHKALSAAVDERQPISTNWLLDSAASYHMTNDRNCLIDAAETDRICVRVANKGVLFSTEHGAVQIGEIGLKDARFVPGLDSNLISMSALIWDGWQVQFTHPKATLTRNGTVIEITVDQDGLFSIRGEISADQSGQVDQTTPVQLSESLLHSRMGHLNSDAVRMLPKAVKGVSIRHEKKQFCVPCVTGKQHRQPNRHPTSQRATRPGEKIHVDLCGGGYTFASRGSQDEPNFDQLPASEGGAKYFVVMTDDFSRYRRTVPLKRKSDAEAAIKEWILEIEARGLRTQAIRRDGGGEFMGQKLTKWLKDRGIREEDSAPYSPEQNGLSEKSVDLVCAKARSMLLATDLPESLWAEAVVTGTYLLNRSPTRSLPRGLTPYEAFHGEKPSIRHLRIFGCVAFHRINKPNTKGKLSPRSKQMRHVGYESTNIYRLWDPIDRRITKSRDVVFNEADLGASTSPRADVEPVEQPQDPVDVDSADKIQTEVETASDANRSPVSPVRMAIPTDPPAPAPTPALPADEQLSDIAQQALNLLGPDQSMAASARTQNKQSVQPCPNSYTKARKDPRWDSLKKAMDKQMDALEENETWSVVDIDKLPPGTNTLSGRWVYTEKEQYNTVLHKARWVVRGFEQEDEEIDWEESKQQLLSKGRRREFYSP